MLKLAETDQQGKIHMSPTIVNGNIKNKMGWVVVGGEGGIV